MSLLLQCSVCTSEALSNTYSYTIITSRVGEAANTSSMRVSCVEKVLMWRKAATQVTFDFL